MNFEDNRLVSDFTKHLMSRGLAEKTILSYTSDIKDFIFFLNKKKIRLNKITKRDISLYFNDLFLRQMLRSSVIRRISSIGSFFEYIYKVKYIPQNPMSFVKRPSQAKSIPKYVTEKDFNVIIDEIDKDTDYLYKLKNKLICYLLYYSGLRISEAIALKIKNIEHLVNNPDKENGDFLNIIGKGNKERIVPIPYKTISLIYEYIKYLKLEGIKSPFVFFSSRANNVNHISRESVNLMLKKVCQKCNIDEKKISPHKLRHSFATDLFRSKVNIRILQDILGHSSINTTSIYISNNSDEISDFVKKNHPISGIDLTDEIE